MGLKPVDLMKRADFGRLGASALALLALAPMLVGCSDLPPIDLAAKMDEGVFALVDGGEPIDEEFEVSASAPTDNRYRDFFVGQADGGWEHGEVLRVDSDRWTLIEESLEPGLEVGDRFFVYVRADVGYIARFVAPKRGVPQDAWLHRDGTITATPCGE